MEFLLAKSYADSLSEAGDEGAASIVSVTALRPAKIIQSLEVLSFFAELISEAKISVGSSVAAEMYRLIVVLPSERVHIPAFIRSWMLITVISSAWLTRRGSEVAAKTIQNPSRRRLVSMSARLIPDATVFALLSMFLSVAPRRDVSSIQTRKQFLVCDVYNASVCLWSDTRSSLLLPLRFTEKRIPLASDVRAVENRTSRSWTIESPGRIPFEEFTRPK